MSIKFQYTPPEDKGETAKPILKSGWYDFQVEGAFENSRDGNKLETKDGDPYIQLKCLEEESGTWIYHSLFFSEMGVAKINAYLHATGTLLTAGEETFLDASAFVGNKFRGKVEITSYNGKQYNKISRVSPIKGEQEQTEPLQEIKSDEIESDLEDEIPF
tara:strand:+ start:148 stop:627 length:480 start_codon:yes stop_codon:yes gene_type:complete